MYDTTLRLRAAFDGRVIAPDDDVYDQARTVFYGTPQDSSRWLSIASASAWGKVACCGGW